MTTTNERGEPLAVAPTAELGLVPEHTEMRKLAQQYLAWQAAGCPVEDPFDTYPTDLWPACATPQRVLALLDELQRLRAALGVLREYPDFDDGGPLPEMIDQVLASKPSPLLDSIKRLAPLAQVTKLG